MSDIETALKTLIIETLELEDIEASDIVSDEPLFGDEDGLGLDSIDRCARDRIGAAGTLRHRDGSRGRGHAGAFLFHSELGKARAGACRVSERESVLSCYRER